MPGEAQHVRPQRLHVHGPRARRLRRIHDEQSAVRMGNLPHAAHIHNVAREVGGVRADNQLRIRTHQALKLGIIDTAAPVGAHEVHSHAALLLQPIERTQHGVVL